MQHQIIHQRPQLPPRNPIRPTAVLRKHAHRASPVDAVGTRSQTRDVGAVAELFVRVDVADEALESLHGGAVSAGAGVFAAEVDASDVAEAVGAFGGGEGG